MNNAWTSQLIDLGISLFVGWLVWKHYRRRTFSPREKYSTFGPRFWTGTVDSCVLWPVSFLSAILLSYQINTVLAAFLVIIESMTWLLYTVVMHARYGMTVGKMVTKVRVVDFLTEGPITYRQSWLREGIPTALSLGILGYQVFGMLSGKVIPRDVASGAVPPGGPLLLLTFLPGLWFIAEVLTMLTNDKRRALHDFIAGTVVIRTNIEQNGATETVAPPAESPGTPEALPG